CARPSGRPLAHRSVRSGGEDQAFVGGSGRQAVTADDGLANDEGEGREGEDGVWMGRGWVLRATNPGQWPRPAQHERAGLRHELATGGEEALRAGATGEGIDGEGPPFAASRGVDAAVLHDVTNGMTDLARRAQHVGVEAV